MSNIEKNILRNKIIELRKKLTSDEVSNFSTEIRNKFFDIPEYKQKKRILFYASFGNEVQTFDLITQSLREKKRVFLPITDSDRKVLIISEIHNTKEDLIIGKGGIPIPKKECKTLDKLDEIEMVIVPGIVFDDKGGRIGFGRGYYDRFLAKLSSNIITIGICFDFQISEQNLPLSSHDIKVKKIITEKRIIYCNQGK